MEPEKYKLLYPTNPSFPEVLLKTLGNNGRLSYKIKSISFLFILYSMGLFVTVTTNTLDLYIKDYPFFVQTIICGITFYAIIDCLKEINSTFSQLNHIMGTRKKEFNYFIDKVNSSSNAVYFYYLYTLGLGIIFPLLGYYIFIGPDYVNMASQNIKYINRIYYLTYLAIMGYGIGCVLNRLIYYSSVIHKYCKKFLLPEKLNMLNPIEMDKLKSLGVLAFKFTFACTIPTIVILTNIFRVYTERGPTATREILYNYPIYAILIVTYVVILVLVFFLPIRMSHDTLIKAKKRGLEHINDMFKQITQKMKTINPEELQTLNNIIITHKRVSQTPTWPLNLGLFVKLLTTVLFPLIGGTILQLSFEYLFTLFI